MGIEAAYYRKLHVYSLILHLEPESLTHRGKLKAKKRVTFTNKQLDIQKKL